MIAGIDVGLGDFVLKCQLPGALSDDVAIEPVETAALLDRFLHAFEGMLAQQKQHADEVPASGLRAVPRFEPPTQLVEASRQLPLAKDVGVIESRRPPLQRCQVMDRLEHITARFVTALVAGNHLAGNNNFHSVGVGFDRCRLKSVLLRHAVTHAVETGRLVLVDLGRLIDARIERRLWQRQCLLPIAFEALPDRLAVFALRALAIFQAASTQIGVQFVEVFGLRDRH